MKTSDFDYYLPERLIAQTPLEKRDSSRLLVYDRKSDITEHRYFCDVPDYLSSGDVLVINDTKVIPARLFGVKKDTQRIVEFLLLKRIDFRRWNVVLRPGKKLKEGDTVVFSEELSASITAKKNDGVAEVEFSFSGVFEELLDRHGIMPLPPYIKEKLADKTRYNTVYAKTEGSAAAPTAGLHFTPELLQELENKGVIIAPILLHVGLGTFRPVKAEDISAHVMHSEFFSITEDSAAKINAAKASGKKVVAVGTTSVRAIESAACGNTVRAESRETDIFIYPGYEFKVADAVITNFHLPKSTLIMLVSAFAGREKTLKLYNMAVSEEYRFFSFGDSMIIL